MFVLLDKEYENFCPKLAGHLCRPLLLKKCLYGADLSGKRWYDTLDQFLTNDLKFVRSRVEGCQYVLRQGNYWIKLINYVDDALYYSNKVEEEIQFVFTWSSKMVFGNEDQTDQRIYYLRLGPIYQKDYQQI